MLEAVEMPKLISRFTVALVTFAVGTTIPSLSSFNKLRVAKATATSDRSKEVAVEPQTLSESQSKTLTPLKQDVNVGNRADLSIVVRVNFDPPSITIRPITLSQHRSTIVDLDLGEDIDGQEVTLAGHNAVRYRVLQRYRTSMTVMAEGPHLDLIDWRHFDSSWMPLRSLASNRFRTLESNQMADAKFPGITRSDMINAVRRRVGKDWPYILQLVKSCRGPNSDACAVMISSIYLRIQKQARDRWIDVGLLEFRMPMGC
jgi:hypothetical protein